MFRHVILLVVLLNFTYVASVPASPAPRFSLPTTTGWIKLSDLRGKIVYVDFWASWCVPCRKSFPWMNKMQERYADKGFVIVAINLDRDKKFVQKFLKSYPANFTIAYDPKGEIASAYKVRGMPSSYLIDSKGEVQYTHIGFREANKPKIEKQINDLLKRQ